MADVVLEAQTGGASWRCQLALSFCPAFIAQDKKAGQQRVRVSGHDSCETVDRPGRAVMSWVFLMIYPGTGLAFNLTC